MKKKKLLVAMLVCMAVSAQVGSTLAAETVYSDNYTVTSPTENHGAIFVNTGDSAIVESTANFVNNVAYRGAGIHNWVNAELTVKDGVAFTGNQAVGAAGGAIQNMGNATLGNNLVFKNNSAKWGGAAVYGGSNSGVGSHTVIGDNAKFINNTLTATDSTHTTAGTYASWGGAIFVENDENADVSFSLGKNAYFEGNSADQGGAVYIKNNIDAAIGSGAEFKKNNASAYGGAILTRSDLSLDKATFTENKSGVVGGAIYTLSKTTVTNTTFTGNNAGSGGAVYNGTTGVFTADGNSEFSGNYTATGGSGGAIMNFGSVSLKDDTNFTGNTAGNAGGAIYSTGTVNVSDNTSFNTNNATIGGAIANIAGGNLAVNGATFKTNTASNVGGAVYNESANATISNATFEGNFAVNGAGIYSTVTHDASGSVTGDASNVSISSSVLKGNIASGMGGAILNDSSTLTLTDTDILNNKAANGAGIYTNSDVIIEAVNKDVTMSGNVASVSGNDMFVDNSSATVSLNAAEDKSITINSGISGATGYTIDVNNTATDNAGSIVLNSAIENATIAVNNGTFQIGQNASLVNSNLTTATGSTFSTVNNSIDDLSNITQSGSTVTFGDGTKLAVDINAATGETDNFSNAIIADGAKVELAELNSFGRTMTTDNKIEINLAEAMGIDPSKLTVSEALQRETQTVLTPIRYLSGSVSETGILAMAPTGNGYKNFNPAIMASPVAAQIGGYLTQLNSYDQAFRNMDMYMLMTRKQREAMKLRNKYAAADGNLIFDPTASTVDDKAVWVRPYATFEKVNLKGGPGVNNVAYGSFFGGDSELYDLGHGWDGMYGIYVGYNGSHQSYDGISIYQNGGTLGLTGMAYKGNYFVGATVNAGANAGEASTFYGNDNFSMLMAGIAAKTGYNWELAEGKFIIQPSMQMSYSFVNTFDYTNAAGVHINSNPLNAIQFEPGIKFIGNLKNGWQPYAGVSVVWNVMDKTHFTANDTSLPELSVKPYVRYGLGIRKTWGEVCTGFLQAFITNGGRNGIGLQGGFKFTLGKGGLKSIKANNNVPKLPKTQINLSSMK